MRILVLRTQVYCVIALAVLGLTSCAPTQVTSTSKDPAYKAADMHRVLVIVSVRKPENQHLLEDEFVRRLTRKGTEAVASHTLVRQDDTQDEESWKKMILDNRFDAVLVSRLTRMNMEEKADTTGSSDPKFLKGPSGFGYYGYRYVYQPAYDPVPEETAVMETRIFNVAENKMMWSGQSKTDIVWGRDPEAQVRDFVRLILGKIYN